MRDTVFGSVFSFWTCWFSGHQKIFHMGFRESQVSENLAPQCFHRTHYSGTAWVRHSRWQRNPIAGLKDISGTFSTLLDRVAWPQSLRFSKHHFLFGWRPDARHSYKMVTYTNHQESKSKKRNSWRVGHQV